MNLVSQLTYSTLTEAWRAAKELNTKRDTSYAPQVVFKQMEMRWRLKEVANKCCAASRSAIVRQKLLDEGFHLCKNCWCYFSTEERN